MRTVLTGIAFLAGCGQSSDVIGDRNTPPRPDDTGWSTDFEACATERVEATLVETSLLVAVDASGSMGDPVDGSGGTTKWEAATSAFTTFFQDPASATLQVALRLWPAPDGCDDSACDASACSQPQVALGSLGDAAHRQALIDTLVGTTPDSGTPMHPALDGASRWAAARLDAAPGESVGIVFVTDGEPNGCDEDIADIAALAAASYAGGAPVYVVGIEGSNVAQIDQIAQAGGTGSGYFVGNASAEADLLAALKAIQAQAVSCTFQFPDDTTADPLSTDLVRVEYAGDSGVVSVDRVANADACAAGGWFLDGATTPPTITLCPTTCGEVQGIVEVAIEIDVGCACESDVDCPEDQMCTEDGCVPLCEDCVRNPTGSLSGNVAVQGGAMSCATASGGGGVLLVAAALVLAARRRRAA